MVVVRAGNAVAMTGRYVKPLSLVASPAAGSFSLATLLFVYAAQKPADGQRRSMHKTAASPFQRIFHGGGSQAVRELGGEASSPPTREIVYFNLCFAYRFGFILLCLHF